MTRVFRAGVLGLTALVSGAVLAGWSAPGHRVITRAAVDALPESLPVWVLGEGATERAAFQANEPDRWRGTRIDALSHENSGEHYIDVEYLADSGLSLRTLPPLRYSFVEALVRGGERPRRERFDPGRVGMLPYAIMEHYAKLVSSLNTARTIERLGDAEREQQLAAARANVLYHMGQLSHFVGDAAQPLHTTIHHHGWEGDNPHGYTTDGSFHSEIDGDVVALHGLNREAIASDVHAADIPADGVWDAVIGLVERSHHQVEPLYRLEASGELEGEGGRRFIAERLADGASVLAGLYRRAWVESEPTDDDVAAFIRYNSFGAESGWASGREAQRPAGE